MPDKIIDARCCCKGCCPHPPATIHISFSGGMFDGITLALTAITPGAGCASAWQFSNITDSTSYNACFAAFLASVSPIFSFSVTVSCCASTPAWSVNIGVAGLDAIPYDLWTSDPSQGGSIDSVSCSPFHVTGVVKPNVTDVFTGLPTSCRDAVNFTITV